MKRNWNSWALLHEMQNGTATMENSMRVPQEKLKMECLCDPDFHFGVYS